MNEIPSKKKRDGKKTVYTLSAIAVGLLGVLSYEVFSAYESPIVENISREKSRPLVILDDDSEDGYYIADNSYSIGKSASNQKNETIETLRSQVNENARSLNDLRSQWMAKGSTADHPRVAELKRNLTLTQDKYKVLLEKKKLLKEELISLKEHLHTKNELYRGLAAKKKEIKDNYFVLKQISDEQQKANQELAKEVEELRVLLANAERARKISDNSNTALVSRVRQLKSHIQELDESNAELQNELARKAVDYDELHLNHSHVESTFKQIVNHHLNTIRGKSDALTKSIKTYNPASQKLAVNFPAKSASLASEERLRLYNQILHLHSISQPTDDNEVADNYTNDALDLNPPPGNESKESSEEHKWTQDNKKLQEDIERLQNELDASQTSSSVLEENVIALNEQITKLSERIALNDWTIDHHRNSNEQALADLEKSNDDKSKIENDLCASSSCNDALTSLVQQLNAQIVELQVKLSEVQDNASKRDEETKSRDLISALQAQIITLQEHLETAQTSINKYEDNIDTLNEKLKDAKLDKYTELGKLEKGVQKAEEEIKDLEKKLSHTQEKLSHTQEKLSKSQKSNEEHIKHIAAIETRLHKAEKANEQLAYDDDNIDGIYDEDNYNPYNIPYDEPYFYEEKPQVVEIRQEESIQKNGERTSIYAQQEKDIDKADDDLEEDLYDEGLYNDNRNNNAEEKYIGLEEFLAQNDSIGAHKEKTTDTAVKEKDALNKVDEETDKDKDGDEDDDDYSDDDDDSDEDSDDDDDSDDDQDSDDDDDQDDEDDSDEDHDDDHDKNHKDKDKDSKDKAKDHLADGSQEQSHIHDEYEGSEEDVDESYENIEDYLAQSEEPEEEEVYDDEFDDNELAWDEAEDERLDDVIEDFGNVDPDPSPPQ